MYRASEQCTEPLGPRTEPLGQCTLAQNNAQRLWSNAQSPPSNACSSSRHRHLQAVPSVQIPAQPLAHSSKIGQAATSETALLARHQHCRDAVLLPPWIRLFPMVMTQPPGGGGCEPQCSLPAHNLLIQLVHLQFSSFQYVWFCFVFFLNALGFTLQAVRNWEEPKADGEIKKKKRKEGGICKFSTWKNK